MNFENLPAKRWWQYEEGDEGTSKSLFALYKALDSLNMGRQQANLRHLRLYNNQEISGLSVANYVISTTPSTVNMKQNRLTLNVIKSCIDTLVSKLCKTKIKVSFLTSGGTWRQQKRAINLNKFMSGSFYKTGFYATAPMCLRDSFIFGDGYAKVYTDPVSKEIKVERVFPDEIRVDPNDGYYGKPQSLYQQKFVAKDLLMEQWPEYADKIQNAQTIQTWRGRESVQCVLVVEAWHLPSKEGASDGKHVIAIESCTLFEEVYKRTRFPIAILRYTEQPLGFYGMGVAEELIGIQVELNRILLHIQQAMRLLSIPRVFVEAGSIVNMNQFTNEIGGIVEYAGQRPPIVVTPSAVSPEYFNQKEDLYRKAYEIVGVSVLSAQSKNPLGSNASGKALREYHDVETERFMLTGQNYEQFHIDVAELILDEVKAHGGGYEVKSFNRQDGLQIISSEELDLDQDDYVMQCFPVSALPDTPSAKLQTITEMMQSGMIDPETGAELLDFPDLDAYTKFQNSPVRLVKRSIEKMLETGELVSPEPYDNLQKCLQMGQFYYQYCKLYDDDEKSLELLRDYIDSVKNMMNQMQAPQPASMPGQELLNSQLGAAPAAQAVPGAALPPVV